MKKYLFGLVGIAMLITLFVLINKVDANPSQFMSTTTSSASSTMSYMTPGAATTTLTFDSQVDGGYPVDSATLMVNFAGSSTASTLLTTVEYSSDGLGWYSDNLLGSNGIASTSGFASLPVQSKTAYTWTFASSTVGGARLNAASAATSTKAFTIATPTRYIRAVFSLNIVDNGAGAVWAQFVGKRQR